MQKMYLILLEIDLGCKSYGSFQECFQEKLFSRIFSMNFWYFLFLVPLYQVEMKWQCFFFGKCKTEWDLTFLMIPEKKGRKELGGSQLCSSWVSSVPRKGLPVSHFSSVTATAMQLYSGVIVLWLHNTAFNLLSALNSYLMHFFAIIYHKTDCSI